MKLGVFLLILMDVTRHIENIGVIDSGGDLRIPTKEQAASIISYVRGSLFNHGIMNEDAKLVDEIVKKLLEALVDEQ